MYASQVGYLRGLPSLSDRLYEVSMVGPRTDAEEAELTEAIYELARLVREAREREHGTSPRAWAALEDRDDGS